MSQPTDARARALLPQGDSAQGEAQQEVERVRHNRRQAAAFDRVADEFLKPIPDDILARMARIVAKACIRHGHAVLDVGTGTGALLPYILSYRPAAVVACDLSAEMLERARCRFGERVRFVEADVVDLPPEMGPFDRVICNAVFGNFYDQEEALRAIRRLLKPRGWVVISHPMGREFVRDLRQSSPDMVLHDLPDERRLATLCAATGLRPFAYVDEPDLYVAIARRGGGGARRMRAARG